jgi:hypothetical protein
MFTGLPLYGGIAALIIITALSGALWVEHGRVVSRTESLEAQKLLVDIWETKVAEKQAKIDVLEKTITEQNKLIEDAANLGEIAQERQEMIDRLLAEKALAKKDLTTISDAYRKLREESASLTKYQVYERVLMSISGGTQ